MQNLFISIYHFFAQRRFLLHTLFVLTILIAGCLALQLKIENDVYKMIPKEKSVQSMQDVLNNSNMGQQIIVRISANNNEQIDPDSLIQLQQLFYTKLNQTLGQPYLVPTEYQQENQEILKGIISNNLPLFLNEEDYSIIAHAIQPNQINESFHRRKQMMLTPAGAIVQQQLIEDPLNIEALAMRKLQQLQLDTNYQVYNEALFNYQMDAIQSFIHLDELPNEVALKLLIQLEDLEKEWSVKYPQVNILLFGAPLVAKANTEQIIQDTWITLSITILALLIFTFYIFKRKRAPIAILLPVFVGGLCGLAFMYIWQGAIMGMALGAGAIILGIAIDFSIHFLSHVRNENKITQTLKELSNPLTLGALTTILAFIALQFTEAPILKDLGLFAASSLFFSALATLIFLPHYSGFIRPKFKQTLLRNNFVDRLAQLKPEKSKWLLIIILVLTPVFYYGSKKVRFDSNLMHLNYMPDKLQEAQDILQKEQSFALNHLYLVGRGVDQDGALQSLEKTEIVLSSLQKEGKVKSSNNPTQLIASNSLQKKKIEEWNQFWHKHDLNVLHENVRAAALKEGIKSTIFSGSFEKLKQNFQPLNDSEVVQLKSFIPQGFAQSREGQLAIAHLKVLPEDRVEVMKILSKYDQVEIADNQSATEGLMDILISDFNKVLFYSGSIVFIALLIAYGRLELALISFLPMLITWIWILGIMGYFGIHFNVVNIIICTLIFGLGDDFSIFMMDSLMEKYKKGKSEIAHTRSGVYLSAITTIIGLGTLVFAQHPALHSIALSSIIGILCVVIISQILQPFLFNILIQNRADRGLMPFTLWSLLKSVFAFTYFFIGCIVVTIIGYVFILLKPFGANRSKYLFHVVLSNYTKSVMYVMMNVRKRVVVEDSGVFNQPAVFIANHSSFLDILLTTMLHPKLVLITNNWVYRSPVFGKIVQLADYYPAKEGAEESIIHLKRVVEQGYGILIFPEGTRSYSGTIGRFKKGAFLLAKELNLPIIPVYLHGAHYTMQKGDWLLKNGNILVNIGKELIPSSMDQVKDIAKNISQQFKTKFNEIKEEIEVPAYFREQLLKNYIYKGPVLEWYCRIKTKMDNNYKTFDRLLPKKGLIYDLGCGYGFMTHMLHWVSSQRSVIGIDYDEDKVKTANHVYMQNATNVKKRGNYEEMVNFFAADINEFNLEKCSGIVISDMLHYLMPEQQESLLQKCINALYPQGVLVVRDGVVELKERHATTKQTEWLSTRVFKFNKTQNELYFLSIEKMKSFALKHHLILEIIDEQKNTSNLIFKFIKS